MTSSPAPTCRPRGRRVVLGALLTAGALTGAGLAAPSATAAGPAVVSLFPTDALTVPDAGQRTGLRVALPTDGCPTVTVCGLVQRLDELDGFDLDPRVALRFAGPVDVADVLASATVRPAGDPAGPVYLLDRAVYDAASHTVYAHPRHQLRPGTTYQLKVDGDHGLGARTTTFTTESARDGLLDLRRQLDDGTAFTAAGIAPADRGLRVDAVVPAAGTTFTYQQDHGPAGGLVDVAAPSLVEGTVVLGSYEAPSWLREDRTIEQVPTRRVGPSALGAQRLPFVLVLPSGAPPAGGWPTAAYGHGFTHSATDVLISAAANSRGGIATIGTDVVGHGYGPRSAWKITRDGATTTVPAYGRGIDLDGDGTIGSTEGSSALPTGGAAAVGSRDGLRQTAADVMTLVRAVGRGQSPGGRALRRTEVTYFGHSFGGIYGTMIAGADPTIARAALSVPGGPISEIVRLSPAFRLLETQALGYAGLLNSTSADKAFFEESLPLRGQPPVLDPAPGALAVQDFLARTTWLDRSGSPETFAPLLRGPQTLVQVAFGDQTVPNPTSFTLLDAGGLFARTSLYRNDRTAQAGTNPHSFLIEPQNFPDASAQGQAQIRAFLADGTTIDPDGAKGVWQVPLTNHALLLPLNYTSAAFPG